MNDFTFDFILPVLYARSETGAVLTWEVEIKGNKYRTITGQKHSANKVVSAWTTATPKNVGKKSSTTPEQQAYAEAEAKWKKKIKSGGYWENESEIDKEKFISPMLAYSLKDFKDTVQYPVMVDRKYNGGRVITNSFGQYTRKGEEYKSIPHLFDTLKPLFKKYPNMVLDAEGYNHELRFKLNELMSILRKQKIQSITDELLARSREIVKLYVYDGWGFGDITKDTPCKERRKALEWLLRDVKYIVPVPSKMAHNESELMEIYEEYVADGYEGAIVRNPDAPYQNKRTSDLLKVKPLDDDEGIIVAITEGSGNWAGTGKVITLNWKGKQFNATFKGTMEQGVEFLKNKANWIGKEVTFNYNGLTGKETPNYATVDINNCLKK